MGDPISTIRSLAAAHGAQAGQLRSSLLQLASRIAAELSDAEVYVTSENAVLERYGDDESVYGFLSYSNGELSVAYRSTEDDVTNQLNQDPGEPTYSPRTLQKCSFKWLRAISQERVIESFFADMISKLDQQKTEAEAGIRTLGNALNAPVRDAEVALEIAARQLGYKDIASDWRRAQASVYTDPREAVTRSSSLIESVCKHILDTKNVLPSQDQSIQPLFKATLKVLALVPEDQPTEDLRKVAGGIISVVHGLGAFRTHVGTAHGRAPEGLDPDHIQARFAVNLAGAVSTFLMEVANPDTVPSKDAT